MSSNIPKHHNKRGFHNLDTFRGPDFYDFLRWHFSAKNNDRSTNAPPFALAQNDTVFLQNNRTENTVTWIGHATVLLQLNGINILTDPQFSERASPVQWAGPRRVVPPGISIDDLPIIDIVIISHDHYDSLDTNSIQNLYKRRGGHETKFFVPLGLKSWLNKQGVSRVFELDWGDIHKENYFSITAVPVQHWSKRGIFSSNKTLWVGWIIHFENFNFIFVGDTGYTTYFKKIGREFGPFDLAAIPIGAYEPRWFMHYYHISPEEAVQIHIDLHAKKSIAIHWGTFKLTDEPLDEPPKRLDAARKSKGISEQEFMVFKHGQTWKLK